MNDALIVRDDQTETTYAIVTVPFTGSLLLQVWEAEDLEIDDPDPDLEPRVQAWLTPEQGRKLHATLTDWLNTVAGKGPQILIPTLEIPMEINEVSVRTLRAVKLPDETIFGSEIQFRATVNAGESAVLVTRELQRKADDLVEYHLDQCLIADNCKRKAANPVAEEIDKLSAVGAALSGDDETTF